MIAGVTTYVGANEAARLLGVTKPTLYAYVSRGVVSRTVAGDGRTSLYPRDQIERLAERNRRPSTTEPTIDIVVRSAVTEIDDRSVHYRSHDAVALARTVAFESVAELLWDGRLPGTVPRWDVAREPLRRARAVIDAARSTGAITPITALALAASVVGRIDGDSDDGPKTAARTLITIAPSVLGGPHRGSIAGRLASAWQRRPDPALTVAIDRALILLADHELATSTLAVRVACSVGAGPVDAFAAGLHTIAGPLHGGASRAVVALLREVARVGAREAVAATLRSGKRLPGFGHSVYRTADPRLLPLLDAVALVPDPYGRRDDVESLLAEAARVLGKIPNVDLGLGALLHVGGLPDDAPVFAVARIAGWAAHYAEEASERPVRYRGLTRPT
jgi:citrate synthase